jgi:serine protease Do
MKRSLRYRSALFAVAAAALFAFAGAAAAQDALTGNPIARIAKEASPSVVNIDVEAMVTRNYSPFPDDPIFRRFFGEEFRRFSRTVPMKGRGSGFIVSADGKILTNNHVVEGADKITVTMSDGRTLDAKILGRDPTFDLAIIKVDGTNLPVLEMGDSDKSEVGEWVVAIGNPFGLEHTVTVGVISAKNRSIHAENVNFDGFLQTDAAINPGNSGGPLIGLDGKVIGINTAIVPYAQGIGFAVPVNMAKQVMNDLVQYGKVRRGWLGVYIQPLTKEFAQAYGVSEEKGAVVSDVMPDSPADKAGLRRGDVIIAVNKDKIEGSQELVTKIRNFNSGETVSLTLIRQGKQMSVSVTLSEVSGSSEDEKSGGTEVLKKIGVEVSRITQEHRKNYGIRGRDGVVVTSVEEGSAAARAGIREGDVVLEINGVKVSDPSQIGNISTKKDSVVLLLLRDGRTFFLSLKLEK